MPESRDESFAFEAMAHPARRQILRLLANGELSSGEIAETIDYLGRTAISNHLKILRTSGLISERRQGRFRFYAVDPAAAQDVVGFVINVYRESFIDLRRAAEDQETAGHTRPRSRQTG